MFILTRITYCFFFIESEDALFSFFVASSYSFSVFCDDFVFCSTALNMVMPTIWYEKYLLYRVSYHLGSSDSLLLPARIEETHYKKEEPSSLQLSESESIERKWTGQSIWSKKQIKYLWGLLQFSRSSLLKQELNLKELLFMILMIKRLKH